MTYSLCLSPCSSAAVVAAPAVVSPALRVFAAPASSSAPAPAVVWLPAAPVVATHKYTHRLLNGSWNKAAGKRAGASAHL